MCQLLAQAWLHRDAPKAALSSWGSWARQQHWAGLVVQVWDLSGLED